MDSRRGNGLGELLILMSVLVGFVVLLIGSVFIGATNKDSTRDKK